MAPNIASPKTRETHRGSKQCFAENESEGAGPEGASPMKGEEAAWLRRRFADNGREGTWLRSRFAEDGSDKLWA